jgi:hypothetical protein
MREILFRGKILEEDDVSQNGNWVYGYLVYAKSDFDDETQRVADIIPHDTDRVYKGEYNVVFPCDIKTIGQYTGLTDKNGKKIFEGDILKGAWETVLTIFFDEISSSYRVKTSTGYEREASYYGVDKWEIIGNIHDNPELLEGENDKL